MINISVINRSGEELQVPIGTGVSLMEALRDAGTDEIRALCGGCCSCATCHIFVHDGADRLLPITAEESDMLDSSLFRKPNSRLSCQIQVTGTFEGLRIEIAPEE